MRAPKNKILFIPDPVPDKVMVGGQELHLPYGTMHGERLHMDWPVTGTVSCRAEIDTVMENIPYKFTLEEGDRVLFHFNVCSPSRTTQRVRHPDYSWCHPWDIFVYWKDGVASTVADTVITDKEVVLEKVLPSGLILLGANSAAPMGLHTGDHTLNGRGALRMRGETPPYLLGSGWERVAEGDTLLFPVSSQIEIRMDGNTSRETDGDVAYRQRMRDVWAFEQGGGIEMLNDYVLVRQREEVVSRHVLTPFERGKDRFRRGEVVLAGPKALCGAGEGICYNDIMGWRMWHGGEELAVVKANREGVIYAY